MSVEDRLEVLELDLIYLENEARALRKHIEDKLAMVEPVAWMYEFAVRSSFDASFTGEWKEEISRAKPDGVVKGFNPTKLESTVRNLVPLYTSLKKQESLSDDEIDLGYQSSSGNYYDLAFRDGVRFAEKYHKIGINNV